MPSFWRTVQTSILHSATNPDLSRFDARGGKLLLWHGWSDHHITPQSTLQHHEATRRTLGGDAVGRFARLYLFPGFGHCSGGPGPNTFDTLTPVMAWAETGTSPGTIIASRAADVTLPARTRPVFPYPAVARYVGSGSIDDAANFAPFTPQGEPPVGYRWVGAPLY